MSKHEPDYKCSKCGDVFLTEEIEEHTKREINEGLLHDIRNNHL